jgi:hypothetical protein
METQQALPSHAVTAVREYPPPRAADPDHALDHALRDAEQLLGYAAKAGIDVEPESAQRIIAATRQRRAAWDAPDAGALMEAITKLAASVHPVTADSLRDSSTLARGQIAKYAKWAFVLAILIVPLSLISFLTSGLSSSITADLRAANDLAVTLHNDLDSPLTAGNVATSIAPASTLTDLQQFAALIRSIKEHAVLLNGFSVWGAIESPLGHLKLADYELNPALGTSVHALQQEANAKTATYQFVRSYAKDVQDNSALFYGAVASIVLPMLYALLGACAYLLRMLADELNKRTFSSSSYAISARFSIALIGGMIVGLFNNFTSGASLPPLALAFLVGYAADAFFSFLEGLLNTLQSKAGPVKVPVVK